MEARAADVIDDRLIRGLHVEAVRRSGLHPEHEPHLVFQTSTLDALFEGDFDGDLTFAELAQHGDFGLGTLNGLDGEMIALDGRFLRADVDGNVDEVPPTARTPFAVVTYFDPVVEFTVDGAAGHEEFVHALNRHAPPGSPVCAVRIDGSFASVHERSVPAHQPPYPSLTEIAHEQHVFDFDDVEGTIVGFRFPSYAQGIPQLEPTRWIDRRGHVVVPGDGSDYGRDVRPCNARAQVTFAHKIGLVDTAASDAGIVTSLPGQPYRHYVVAMLTNLGSEYGDPGWGRLNPCGTSLGLCRTEKFAQLGRLIDNALLAGRAARNPARAAARATGRVTARPGWRPRPEPDGRGG